MPGLSRASSSDRRPRLHLALAGLLVTGLLTGLGALGVVTAPRAAAAEPLTCGPVYAVQGSSPRNLWAITPGADGVPAGQETVGTFDVPGSNAINALGISATGADAYGVKPAEFGSGRTIYQHSRATETTTALGSGVAGSPVTHGAVDPKSGIYYYGGFNPALDNRLEVYGFDPARQESLGLVAAGSIPRGGNNGDWAFDQQGRLYVVGGNPGSNVVAVVDQEIPTTVQSTPIALTGKEIVRNDSPVPLNGIAFHGDGQLYLANNNQLWVVDPGTGSAVSTHPLSLVGSVDLASCASPNTVTLRKDFPDNRYESDDQVRLTISGGGIASGNTGLTQGDDAGVQDGPAETAGPVFALSGREYTISETGAGTRTPQYERAWRCVDLNTGSVLASGSGSTGSFTLPNGGPSGVAADCVFTNAARIPDVSLDKQASEPSGNTPGASIDYTFVVTNTGTTPLATTTIDDPKVGRVTCPDGELAPGESKTCTADAYRLTQDDVDAGTVDNTATVTATPTITGLRNATDTDSTTTPISQTATLSLQKSAAAPIDVNGSGLTDAGDTVAYTFQVTNTGTVVLRGLDVVDPLVGATSCESTTLAPGDVTDCTADAPYVVTDEDEEQGEVVNTARAAATRPGGDPVESGPSSTRTPVQVPDPVLEIDKRASDPEDVNASGITDAGDTIAYSFTVTNAGNVPLSAIKVRDPKAGDVTCEETSLAPGAATECTADEAYTVTENDEVAGEASNTATATGSDPDDGDVESGPDTTATPVTSPAPELSIDKRATPEDTNSSGITDARDQITYAFTVTNEGNVPVVGVAVDDPLAGSVTCEETTLAVGESTECTADDSYTITDEDEEAEVVSNVARATGEDPDGGVVESPEDVVNVPVTQQAAVLTLQKRAAEPADVNSSGLVDAGDTIAYSFTVSNDGNVPVSDLVVDDPLVGAVTCEETSLAPGDSTDCVADTPYPITLADEVRGEVSNVAVADGLDPNDRGVRSNEATVSTPVEMPDPRLSLDKIASTPEDVNASGLTDTGDRIRYAFDVRNVGNVPVRAVEVSDPRLGSVTCPEEDLSPGQQMRCESAPYEITDDDERSGSVDNLALAQGLDPDEDPVISPEDETSTPTQVPDPRLTLTKTAETPVDVNESGITDAGDTVAYTFTVTNEGDVPVSDVVVDDPLVGSVTCETTALAPGASAQCRADRDYEVTEEDENVGSVDNRATATGRDPDDEAIVTDEAETSTPVQVPSPALVLDKQADAAVDVDESGRIDAGDTIQYRFVVTNEGNVPIDDVSIDDPLVGSVTCEETTLPPGGTTECVADSVYTLTAADERSGSVENRATAVGRDPDGDPVDSPPDRTATPVDEPVEPRTDDEPGGVGRLPDAGGPALVVLLLGLAGVLTGATMLRGRRRRGLR